MAFAYTPKDPSASEAVTIGCAHIASLCAARKVAIETSVKREIDAAIKNMEVWLDELSFFDRSLSHIMLQEDVHLAKSRSNALAYVCMQIKASVEKDGYLLRTLS